MKDWKAVAESFGLRTDLLEHRGVLPMLQDLVEQIHNLISASRMPRVETMGVPSLMPLATAGGFSS